jgi:hypothetical protein
MVNEIVIVQSQTDGIIRPYRPGRDEIVATICYISPFGGVNRYPVPQTATILVIVMETVNNTWKNITVHQWFTLLEVVRGLIKEHGVNILNVKVENKNILPYETFLKSILHPPEADTAKIDELTKLLSDIRNIAEKGLQ